MKCVTLFNRFQNMTGANENLNRSLRMRNMDGLHFAVTVEANSGNIIVKDVKYHYNIIVPSRSL